MIDRRQVLPVRASHLLVLHLPRRGRDVLLAIGRLFRRTWPGSDPAGPSARNNTVVTRFLEQNLLTSRIFAEQIFQIYA